MFEARKYFHITARTYTTLFVLFSICTITFFSADPFTSTYSASAAVNPVAVSVPHMTAQKGTDFTIPVTVGDTTGEGIRAFQFDLLYDNDVILPQAAPVDTTGTIAAGMSVTFNDTNPGILRVVFFSSQIRTGAGTLFNFKFTAVGDVGDVSPLTWQNFMFNEGIPGATPSNGSVTIIPYGFEGDVADRFIGDGMLFSNDVIIARQMAAGLLTINPAFNEFQRADTSPAATLGDGQVDSSDVIQTRRYASGLDAVVPAGGPTGPMAALSPPTLKETTAKSGGRAFRITGSTADAGDRTSVGVELHPSGNEAAASFTLRFDPAKLTVLGVSLAPGMETAVLTVNTASAADGIVGVLIDSDTTLMSAETARRMIVIDLAVARDATPGKAAIDFASFPAAMSVSDQKGSHIAADFQSGGVMITRSGWFGYLRQHLTSPEISAALF